MQNHDLLSEYYSKSASVLRFIRYCVFLLFVIFLLVCVVVFGKDITLENLHSILKFVSVHDGSGDMYDGEFSINGSEDATVLMLRDNLAVIKNDNISLYELSGNKLYSFNDIAYSSPVAVGDSQNFLVYDLESPTVSIFNSLSMVHSYDEYEEPIRCADINDHGFVVVSNMELYKSVMYVYDEDFKEQFVWKSSNNYITSVSFADNGKYIAVSCVNSDKGAYNSVIKLFDVDTKSIIHEEDFFGEIPFNISISDDCKSISVITDSQIRFFNSSLKETSAYKYNQSKIENYYIENDLIILTERNNLSGNSMKLTGLSFAGDILFNLNVSDEIIDIAVGSNKMFALGKKNIFEFKLDSSNAAKLERYVPSGIKYNGLFIDTSDRCYVFNESDAIRVDFAPKEKKEDSKK